MKKSSSGLVDVSLLLASSGGGFFWVCGFDFGDSVCALKLHAPKTAMRINANGFIVFGKKCISELLDLPNAIPLKQQSRRDLFPWSRDWQTAVTIARSCSRAFPAISRCYSGRKSEGRRLQSQLVCPFP